MDEQEWLAERFEEHRAHLRAVAILQEEGAAVLTGVKIRSVHRDGERRRLSTAAAAARFRSMRSWSRPGGDRTQMGWDSTRRESSLPSVERSESTSTCARPTRACGRQAT